MKEKMHLFSRTVHGVTVAVFAPGAVEAEPLLAEQARVVCLLVDCPGGCCQQHGGTPSPVNFLQQMGGAR